MTSPKHRAARPRYGRLAALAASLSVVAVALVSTAGGWDRGGTDASGARASTHLSGDESPAAAVVPAPEPSAAAPDGASATSPDESGGDAAGARGDTARAGVRAESPAVDAKALPAGSGSGRRIVFDQSAQRIWLVDGDGHVKRTYLGSGSLLDNLHPGTYSVFSRSRWAVGVDDSGVMQYFVRFTHGPSGAAIGFHTIPTKGGMPLQSESELGTPQSHGCIRQRTSDAIALWEFAPEGTTVVVVA
jgi:hypothetical protein